MKKRIKEIDPMEQYLYNIIVSYVKVNFYQPSYREMLVLTKYKSLSDINRLLKSMEEKGMVKKIGNRAIKLLQIKKTRV
jgi:SOS-response transcriptional repressor LexA